MKDFSQIQEKYERQSRQKAVEVGNCFIRIIYEL